MARLKAAVAAFQEFDPDSLSDAALGEEVRDLRSVVDSLEAAFCRRARAFQRRGGHLLEGAPSAVSWLRHNCKMSSTSAADRLCVGKELESLPKVAEALAAGEIGYQSTSVLCHLREQLGEKRELFVEAEHRVGHDRVDPFGVTAEFFEVRVIRERKNCVDLQAIFQARVHRPTRQSRGFEFTHKVVKTAATG